MVEIEVPKVGGDVDAFCSRCDMDLAQTVVAMVGGKPVQTKCNTCGTFHRYRPPKSGQTAKAKGAGRRKSAGKKNTARADQPSSWEIDWQQQVAQAGNSDIRKYRMTESFSQGNLLQHSKYGVGVVQQKIGEEKVNVLFRLGLRTLIINRPAPAQSR